MIQESKIILEDIAKGSVGSILQLVKVSITIVTSILASLVSRLVAQYQLVGGSGNETGMYGFWAEK